MHFITLVTTELPKIEENLIENEMLKEDIVRLKKAIELAKDDGKTFNKVFLECQLKELQGMQNTFARRLQEVIYDKLEPFCEHTEDPRYLSFESIWEDIEYAYEKETVKCVKFPNGKIISTNIDEFNDKFFLDKDNIIKEKNFGRLKTTKTTKRTRKMKFLELPVKKVYATIDDFAKAEYADSYVESENGYGFYCNPNSFFDWCQIGGRWNDVFLIKEECIEYSLGCLQSDKYRIEAPKGYKWVAAARKKDIEWDVMQKLHKEFYTNSYNEFVSYLEKGECPKEGYFEIKEDKLFHYGMKVFTKGDSLKDFLALHGVFDETKYSYPFYGMLRGEDDYIEQYSIMDCLGEKKPEEEVKWIKTIEEYIETLSEDTVLVGVDCHI